jgi:hypothetical protein
MTATSLFDSLFHGSFLSDASLLEARDGYRPTENGPTPTADFEQRARRMAVQTELVAAREIAGLPEETLAALAAEFRRAPRRKRTDPLRLSIPFGLLMFAAGLLGLLSQNSFLAPPDIATLSTFQVLSVITLGIGLFSAAVGALAAFNLMPVEVAYGNVGLYVGELDEQHPWLYKTYLVMRNEAANAYRLHMLAQRGRLRGADYVLMREIARVDEASVMTQTAGAVAAQIQQLPEQSTAYGVTEPTVAPTHAPSANADSAAEPLEIWPPQATTVIAFGSSGTDRRRPA